MSETLATYGTRHAGELRPCPFCGESVAMFSSMGQTLYWIVCPRCRASTPSCSMRVDAIAAWTALPNGVLPPPDGGAA